MIWTLRICNRRLSSGERVGKAEVPVEVLAMTERSIGHVGDDSCECNASTSDHDGPPQEAGKGAAHCQGC